MSTETGASPALGAAACSALERASAYRRAHVGAIYAGRKPEAPRQGWALCDQYLMQIAPHLAFDRGDGWSTLAQACLYPDREMAEAYAATRRGTPSEVVFCRHDPESPNAPGSATTGGQP